MGLKPGAATTTSTYGSRNHKKMTGAVKKPPCRDTDRDEVESDDVDYDDVVELTTINGCTYWTSVDLHPTTTSSSTTIDDHSSTTATIYQFRDGSQIPLETATEDAYQAARSVYRATRVGYTMDGKCKIKKHT